MILLGFLLNLSSVLGCSERSFKLNVLLLLFGSNDQIWELLNDSGGNRTLCLYLRGGNKLPPLGSSLHTPDSLLGVSKRLSKAGEIWIEVDGRRDDLQKSGLDLYWKTGNQTNTREAEMNQFSKTRRKQGRREESGRGNGCCGLLPW